ncbi:N-methyl-L-tryptophan oxidase [Manganibacter manganicus]|nr:N-methyl-L-tryptophan oxidase [Pseudaminobacter manganicus]
MSFCDVAVVGLGAMGSAALFHLARRGVRAIGIERFEIGHERGSSHGESRAIRLGYFEHPSYVPLARKAYENWRALETLTNETILTVTGILEMGKPGSMIVKGSLAASRLHGLPHEALDARAIEKRFPQFHLPDGYSGVWQPDGGFLQPEKANALHVKLAQATGARVVMNNPVLAIESNATSVRIITEQGTFEAGSVIVSTGAWVGEFVPQLKPVLTLTRQVLCWFEARDPADVALGSLPVFIIDGADGEVGYGFPQFTASGFKCAFHNDSGVLADAASATQDAGPADEARMRRFLERYLPAAAGPLKKMRTCIYTKTPDEDFIIDLLPADPRIVVASPCSGHGYKFASVIGEALADLATERMTAHDLSRFTIERFAS